MRLFNLILNVYFALPSKFFKNTLCAALTGTTLSLCVVLSLPRVCVSQLLVLGCQSLLHGLGYYRIILYTFYLEAGMAAVMLALGPQQYYCLAVFVTVNM